MGKYLFALFALVSLAGCATRGSVESDIPGLAVLIAKPVIDLNLAIACPNYKAAYGSLAEVTTEIGLTRSRVEFSFICE